MSVPNRVRAVEKELCRRPIKILIVVWPNPDEALTRERVDRARRRGWKVRVMRFVTLEANGTPSIAAAALPPWLQFTETSP